MHLRRRGPMQIMLPLLYFCTERSLRQKKRYEKEKHGVGLAGGRIVLVQFLFR
jgi:hypothetical protein